MLNRLTSLKVGEVSLVQRAANQRRFLLLKADDGNGDEGRMNEIISVIQTPVEVDEKAEELMKQANLSEATRDMLRASLRLSNAFRKEVPVDLFRQLAALLGFGESQVDEDEHKEVDEGMPEEKVASAITKEDLDKLPAEMRPFVETLWKQQEEAVKKAEALEKALNDQRDRQALREAIAKADSFKALPIKADEFGPVLKALADKAPEEMAKVEEVLKAADEALRQSSIFKELGSDAKGGPGTGGAWSKIEAAAAQIVQKAESSMTKEQAIAKVLAENPALYQEYLGERSGR